MLQFIVLGLVPGTQYQITFEWIVVFLVFVGFIALYMADFAWLRRTGTRPSQTPSETLEQLSFPV